MAISGGMERPGLTMDNKARILALVLAICAAHDVTISLGDGLRHGLPASP